MLQEARNFTSKGQYGAWSLELKAFHKQVFSGLWRFRDIPLLTGSGGAEGALADAQAKRNPAPFLVKAFHDHGETTTTGICLVISGTTPYFLC